MAEPTWLAGGNTPHVSDSRWFVWARICGRAYDLWGTDPDDKPKQTDTLWTLQEKVNRITDAAGP